MLSHTSEGRAKPSLLSWLYLRFFQQTIGEHLGSNPRICTGPHFLAGECLVRINGFDSAANLKTFKHPHLHPLS